MNRGLKKQYDFEPSTTLITVESERGLPLYSPGCLSLVSQERSMRVFTEDQRLLRIRLYPSEWEAMIRLMHVMGAETPSQLIRDYIYTAPQEDMRPWNGVSCG